MKIIKTLYKPACVVAVLLQAVVALAQKDTTLQERLTHMVEEDQAIRKYADTVFVNYGRKSAQHDSLMAEWNAQSERHNAALKKIISELRSYPDYSLVGYAASHNFWLLVQHQDNDTAFQKQVLKMMKYALDYKQASAIDFAYLTDRVRVNTGGKQLYGTQFRKSEDGIYLLPQPIEDSANVDKRRAEVGLPSLDSYIQGATERFKYRLRGNTGGK